MYIAVACRDGKSVAGHIGKCADWILYRVTAADHPDAPPTISEVERIKLPKELLFHHYKDDGNHPLKSCRAVIGASAGESFVTKMERRGIEAVLTAEADPRKAVEDYIHHSVIPPKPRPIGGLVCKIRDALSGSD